MLQNKHNVTLMPEFNLSQLHAHAHKQGITTPTEFINSNDCKELLKELTGQSQPHHFTFYLKQPAKEFYTHSRWLFLAYIRYCFGNNLTTAIAADLIK